MPRVAGRNKLLKEGGGVSRGQGQGGREEEREERDKGVSGEQWADNLQYIYVYIYINLNKKIYIYIYIYIKCDL